MRPALSFFEFVDRFVTVIDPRTKRPVPMKLYPTQVRFARTVLETKNADGTRRYRRALYGAPKKTGKSAFLAALMLWHLIFEHETDKEIILFAWDLDQTEYLFNAATGIVQRNPLLNSWVWIGKREIVLEDENGRHSVRRIARDSIGSHGGSASLVCGDELWTQPDASMLSALSFSPVRREPLMIFGSYAGYENDQRPGLPLFDLWSKLQPGAEPDPTFFGVWMTGQDARREVPWWSERWLEEQARLLASDPGAFRRLCENEWSQSAMALFTPAEVQSMVDYSLRPLDGVAA